MKYIIAFVLSVLVLLSASSVSAAAFAAQDRVTVPADTVITNDYYAAGGEIVIDGTIDGDLYVSGGQVRVNGNVTGDVAAAGGDVIIKGKVDDDVRVTGGQVLLSGPVGGDLLAFGGNIEVDKDSSVAGDTTIAGGQVTLSGKLAKVQAYVGGLVVNSTAVVTGDLTYMSQDDARIENGSTIAGKLTKQPIPQKEKDQASRVWYVVISTIMTALFAGLFLWLFPRKTAEVVAESRSNLMNNFLTGSLFLILVPIVCGILFATIVGIPLGIGGVFLYVIFLYLAKLVAVICVGAWFERLWEKGEETTLNYLTVIVGAMVVCLVGLIPAIGSYLVFIVMLIALGGIVRFDLALFKKLRADETV